MLHAARQKNGPSSKAGASLLTSQVKLTQAPGEMKTSMAPTSMITQNGQQPVQKRVKPRDHEIFQTEVESIKQRNERKIAQGEDPESKQFGRWAQ